jgi:predicted nucleotidyltransferase
MPVVQTLDERKKVRVDAIRAGFATLRDMLGAYGRENNGRFIVYGSAVSGAFHSESDVDILADFPADRTADALSFVEAACRRLGLKADVQPKSWCTPEFVDRVLPTALVLP